MKIDIRQIIESDCAIIYEWANDPDTRRHSFNSEAIKGEEHQQWFYNKLSDDNCYWYHFSLEQNPIGHVRIEKNEDTIISVTIAPEFRRKGLGAEIIKIGCQAFWKSNNNDIIAYIKNTNPGSIKSFEKAGFKKDADIIIKHEPCVIFKATKDANRLI